MPTTPLFPLPEGLEMTSISDTPAGTARECDLIPRQFALSAVCNAFICHSQLVPEASPGSALHCSSHSLGVHAPQVLLSQPQLFSASVFAERLPDFIEASSRLTKSLRTSVQDIGFATCGKGGEQLSEKLGMGISDASLLWSLFLVPVPEVGKVRVIGVDDGSWRRGQRFGTVLVNLETHKIVDLLADREAESVK